MSGSLSGESVCWSETQRGLVVPALRGRGKQDNFFNRLSKIIFSTGWKLVGDDPALHRSYVERGYSMVVGGTAQVGPILIGFSRRNSVSRSGMSGLKLRALTGE